MPRGGTLSVAITRLASRLRLDISPISQPDTGR